ncbi:MAG: PP2C family protein-serine/threonine phosphatase [Pseudomonadota bacterium]
MRRVTRADGRESTAGAVPAPLRALVLGAGATAIEASVRARGVDVSRTSPAEAGQVLREGAPWDACLVEWAPGPDPGVTMLAWLADETWQTLSPLSRPFLVALIGAEEDGPAALKAGADAVLPHSATDAALDGLLALLQRLRTRRAAALQREADALDQIGSLQARLDGIEGDLIAARQLQQALLGMRRVDLSNMELSTILRSAAHVGGDLVGHFPINADAYGFFALDVSGHGISSALLTARLAGYLPPNSPRQNLALREDGAGGWVPRSPEDTITELNERVMEDLATDHYFTLLLGHIYPATGDIVFAQAGHPHPAVQDARGRVRLVGEGGLPVGLIPGAYYENTTLTLAPGERLFVYSDGFADAVLSDGSLFGDDRLLAIISKFHAMRGSAFLEAMLWELGQALGDGGFYQDDVSALLLERRGSPKT